MTQKTPNDEEKFEFEKLKLIYEKAAEHHKYYLTWRQMLLAGYFAVIGLIFYSMYILADKGDIVYSIIAFGIGILGFYLSKTFISFDVRNSDLYHACQRVCKHIEIRILDLENKRPEKESAFFYELSDSYNKKPHETHSDLIKNIFTWGGALGLISAGIVVVRFVLIKFFIIHLQY